MNIHKKIVTDEDHRPVAVQIDYDDWLRIERALDLETPDTEEMSDTSAERDSDLGALLNASKGIWEGGDGLEYQRRIRAEWTRPWDPEAQENDAENI